MTDTNQTNPSPIARDTNLLYVLALKLAQTGEIKTLLYYIAQGNIIDMSTRLFMRLLRHLFSDTLFKLGLGY